MSVKRPRKVDSSDGLLRVAAEAREEITRCQRDAALDALGVLVRYVKRVGGFMEHRDQLILRNAEALLVEAGRSVER